MATGACQKLLELSRKIVGVGRNYAAHAKELGNAVPKEPVLFLKRTSSYLKNGGTIQIQHNETSLHHEVELAVVIGKKARGVQESSEKEFCSPCELALIWGRIVGRERRSFVERESSSVEIRIHG